MITGSLGHPYLWWVLYLFAFIFLYALIRAALSFGNTCSEKLNKIQKGHVLTSSKAMIGLTGFLLAISFNIAETKFSSRKAMILKEANVVGTSFLRSFLLPEEYQQKAQSLLKKLASVRHRAVKENRPLDGQQASGIIQKNLWKIAIKAEKADPRSHGVRLFTESLNELIDTMEERWTVSIYYDLPKSMATALFLSTLLSIGLLAFSYGLKGSKSWWIPMLPGGLFVIITIMVVDLSKTRQHFFSISQAPIKDTIQMMETW